MLTPSRLKRIYRYIIGLFLSLFSLASYNSALAIACDVDKVEYQIKEGFQPNVAYIKLPPIDRQTLINEAEAIEKEANYRVPYRFATSISESIHLTSRIGLSVVDGDCWWRIHVTVPNAVNMNLGFEKISLADGVQLRVSNLKGTQTWGPYTSKSLIGGDLWTPIVEGDTIVLELFVPQGAAVKLPDDTFINPGFRGFATVGDGIHKECNINVICPRAGGWERQRSSVATYTVKGKTQCTGQLINNTAKDYTRYFLSARHCKVTTKNDHTLVFYWNFQAKNCNDRNGDNLDDNQRGAVYVASNNETDFLLLKLVEKLNPNFKLYFAGWNRDDIAAKQTVTIHHPQNEAKSISFNGDVILSSRYRSSVENRRANFWRVDDWEHGTVESGSSGACLWNEKRQCIGQLSGGEKPGCPIHGKPSWFGKLNASWDAGSVKSERLKDWLDPSPGYKAEELDGMNAY